MTNIFLLMWLADSVQSLSIVLFLVSIITLFVSLILSADGLLNNEKKSIPIAKRFGYITAILLAICVIIPSRSTINIAIAASATEALASTDIGQKSITAINVILDEIINRKEK